MRARSIHYWPGSDDTRSGCDEPGAGSRNCYTEQTEAFHERAQFIHSTWQLDAVCELFAEIAGGSLELLTDTTAELLGRPAKRWQSSRLSLRPLSKLLTDATTDVCELTL